MGLLHFTWQIDFPWNLVDDIFVNWEIGLVCVRVHTPNTMSLKQIGMSYLYWHLCGKSRNCQRYQTPNDGALMIEFRIGLYLIRRHVTWVGEWMDGWMAVCVYAWFVFVAWFQFCYSKRKNHRKWKLCPQNEYDTMLCMYVRFHKHSADMLYRRIV